MNYEETKQKLASSVDSFTVGLYLLDTKKQELDFVALVDDIIACLRVANTFFNGLDANNRSGPADHSRIHEIAYSVSNIINEGLKYHLKWSRNKSISDEVCDLLNYSLFKIAYAWDQLLASDMSDILEGFDITIDYMENKIN